MYDGSWNSSNFCVCGLFKNYCNLDGILNSHSARMGSKIQNIFRFLPAGLKLQKLLLELW